MNAIEDRLRDAYRAAADTVGPDSVPALTDLRAPGRRTGSRGIPPSPGDQRWRKLAIPVAAAVAVSAIAATAWLARPDGGSPGGLGPALGGGAPPPFIVGPPGQHGLAVYSATSGKLLAHIPDPGRGLDFLKTAATGNDRAFVVSAARTNGGCYTQFYRLLLTREGHLASMTRLAVPRARNQMAYGVAASADGKTIAYTAGPCNTGGDGQVSVLHVGSQAVRTWSLTSEGATSPALSPDGRMLYFANSTVLAGDGTVRALRTDAPAGPVSRRARVVLPASAWVSESGSIALARGGRALLVCSLDQGTATLAAYNPANGARLSVIRSWKADPTAGACMVAATPAGNRALISGTGHGLGTRVDLTTGRFRQIPSQVGTPPAGISGGLSW